MGIVVTALTLSFLGLAYGAGPLTELVCTFEQGDCGWKNEASESLRSTDWDTATGNPTTGLGRDHTLGISTGKYKRISPLTSITAPDISIARYRSPVFQPDDRYCVRFWYKLYGQDTHPIKLYVEEHGGRGYAYRTFNSSNERKWTLAEVDMDAEYTSATFQIVIESATSGYRYTRSAFGMVHRNADMVTAIDDVYIVNRRCNAIPDCPLGFTSLEVERGLLCLQFHVNVSTWIEAAEKCRSFSPYGHLVSLDDAVKEAQVIRYIRSNMDYVRAAEHGVWTSGSDLESEGTWYWTDKGDNRRVEYRNWRSGQPNHVGSRQNCLAIHPPGFQWGDDDCHIAKPYICQIHHDGTRPRPGSMIG